MAPERYLHETIKKIDIAVPDVYGDDMKDLVEDPIEETAVAIDITINRYFTTTTTQSSSSTTAATATAGGPEKEEDQPDDTTDHFYVLDGFLEGDVDQWRNELNKLVHNKTVTAGTLREIKKTLMKNSSRIKKIAWQLKPEGIAIDMTLDLLTWYDNQEDQEEVVLNDDDDDEDDYDEDDFEEEEEEMSDQDDMAPEKKNDNM